MEQPERQRIDKWLFFARAAKSRTLGGKLAAGGNVRVNSEKIDQASFLVKPGDVLTITLERRILVLRNVGLRTSSRPGAGSPVAVRGYYSKAGQGERCQGNSGAARARNRSSDEA